MHQTEDRSLQHQVSTKAKITTSVIKSILLPTTMSTASRSLEDIHHSIFLTFKSFSLLIKCHKAYTAIFLFAKNWATCIFWLIFEFRLLFEFVNGGHESTWLQHVCEQQRDRKGVCRNVFKPGSTWDETAGSDLLWLEGRTLLQCGFWWVALQHGCHLWALYNLQGDPPRTSEHGMERCALDGTPIPL